jgi:hypothetical protein
MARHAERVKITRDELYVALDRVTRASLGVSAQDFIVRYQRGELDPTSPIEAQFAAVVRLLLEDKDWARANGNGSRLPA